MTQVQLKARNTVVLCTTPGKPGDAAKGVAPTPPETKEIAPGKLFSVDAATAKALTSGVKPAAERYEAPADGAEDEGTPKKAPAKKAPAKKAAEPKSDDGPDTDSTGTTGKSDRI